LSYYSSNVDAGSTIASIVGILEVPLEGMSVLQADLILVLASALWGGGFPATKWALLNMQPCSFLAWRFLIATLLLVIIFPRKAFPRTRFEWTFAASMGTLLGLGYVFQTIGLQYTSTGKAGFITGLTIVFVPVIDAVANRRGISPKNALGIFTSFLGLSFLCITTSYKLESTDLWIVACAVSFAFQIVGLSRWGAKVSVLAFTTAQLFFSFVVSAVGALILEAPTLTHDTTTWFCLAYTAILATALTFVIQTKVQPYTSPTHAALIYALEAVFATIMGWLWLDEHLTTRDLLGCALIGLGIVIVEIKGRAKPEGVTGEGYS